MKSPVMSIARQAQRDTDDQDLILAQQAVDWSVSDTELEKRVNLEGGSGNSSC